MPSLLTLLCACFAVSGQPAGDPGFLYQPAFSLDNEIRYPLRCYQPQPGDMFFSTDKWWIIRFGHKIAGAHAPHHSGIILQKPNGQFCTLEAGPHNCLTIKILDMGESLASYEAAGNMVWVRRRSVPLTKEQSARLTQFAMAQDGKRFALFRMLGQVTHLGSRGLLWTGMVGSPNGDRDSYFLRRTGDRIVRHRRLTQSQPHPPLLHLSQRPVLRQVPQSIRQRNPRHQPVLGASGTLDPPAADPATVEVIAD